MPNRLAYDGIKEGVIKELQGYSILKREHTAGNSRFDLLLSNENGDNCFVEVKGVTLEKDGLAMFPDAPTERGRKHFRRAYSVENRGE